MTPLLPKWVKTMTATSNNYADALFILAKEENKVEGFYKDLCLVKKVLDDEPEYLQFLSTPSIPKAERTSALEKAFGDEINLHVLSFLQLLCEKGKFHSFSDIVADFSALREYWDGSVKAVVKSAVPLTLSQEDRLLKKLEKQCGKNVILEKVIDKSVLGGLTVELDGKVLDGSVKTNLKHIRDVIGV